MIPTLYQICFEENQISQVKAPMTPFDNTSNERPELREYHSFKKIIDSQYATELYGVFGPRAEEKLRYSGKKIYDEILANSGKEFYLFNHARVQSVVFLNVWEQGEYFHPGIKKIMKYVLDKNDYDYTVLDSIMIEKQMCFCNYFVATKKAWIEYMRFVDIIKHTLDSLPNELAIIYHGSANYARDISLGMFPFIVERLLSTYLKLNSYNVHVKPYDYSLYTNYSDFINHFNTLHRLKECSISDADSFDSWHHLRNETMAKYPNIIHLD